MKALDDTKIIDLFFERDETAIRYASEKYGNRLRSLSHNIVKDRQTAEAICIRSLPGSSVTFP